MASEMAIKLRRKAANELIQTSAERLAAALDVEGLPEILPSHDRAWQGAATLEAVAQLLDRAATKAEATATTKPRKAAA